MTRWSELSFCCCTKTEEFVLLLGINLDEKQTRRVTWSWNEQSNELCKLEGIRTSLNNTQRPTHLNLLASSINGRFCISVSSFHSAPNRLLISELCIFGFSTAILRRCPLLHTMKAFIGRLMCDVLCSTAPCVCWWFFDENDVIFRGNSLAIVKNFISSRNSRISFFNSNCTFQ